ncbi:MAG: hypothetical protein D6798_08305 [Deltaproteobacteria bacterium]|nr:MAG: hypothetical protein D6798_08305 [Deltaproteobacteria bacterium]
MFTVAVAILVELLGAGPARGAAAAAPGAGGTAAVADPAPAVVQEPAADEPAPAVPHLDLERLYTEGRFDEALASARAQLQAHPEDVDLYWHVARAMYEIGERVQKDRADYDKEAWYAEMLSVCERGLALDPDHPHLLFGKGIALGRLGTTRGIIASIRYADDIEAAWKAAADSDTPYRSLGGEEILPCDAYMALGTFYRLVPDMWIVKVLTGTRGDLGEALRWLERADRCSPGRIEILKELGVARICYGQRHHSPEHVVQGVALLRRVAEMPPTKPTDVIDVRHAAMVADDPDMACAYSRDGQAEIDARQLEEMTAGQAP